MAGEKIGDMAIIRSIRLRKREEFGVIVAIKAEPKVRWGRIFTVKFPDDDELHEVTYDELSPYYAKTLKEHVKHERTELLIRAREWKKLKKLKQEVIASQ